MLGGFEKVSSFNWSAHYLQMEFVHVELPSTEAKRRRAQQIEMFMKTTTEQQPITSLGETIPKPNIEPKAAHSESQAFPGDSAKLSQGILRQYEALFGADRWLHSGLND